MTSRPLTLRRSDDRIRLGSGEDSSTAMAANSTSMMDVIFILLIFFVSISQLRESKIEVGLQEVDGAQGKPETIASKLQSIDIAITADDAVYLQDEPVDVDVGLAERLNDVVALHGADVKVQLRSDSQARSGTMLRILGLLSKAGLNRVHFAVTQQASPGTQWPAAGVNQPRASSAEPERRRGR